jgi:hypothetical protein
MRKLAFTFTEEIDEAVSAAAAESYTTREGEMITAEVVAVGPGGEVLLKMRDGAFACLPAEEAIPDKRYVQGDSVSALVRGVTHVGGGQTRARDCESSHRRSVSGGVQSGSTGGTERYGLARFPNPTHPRLPVARP